MSAGAGAQGVVEDDVAATFGQGVEDGPGGDGDAQHFFQADGLAAELDLVVVPASAFAALVFDGEGRVGAAGVVGAEFDEVRDADDAQAMADEPEAAGGAEGAFVVVAGGVDAAWFRLPAAVWALLRDRPSRRWRGEMRGQKRKSLRADSRG